jgi:hypothetical protein
MEQELPQGNAAQSSDSGLSEAEIRELCREAFNSGDPAAFIKNISSSEKANAVRAALGSFLDDTTKNIHGISDVKELYKTDPGVAIAISDLALGRISVSEIISKSQTPEKKNEELVVETQTVASSAFETLVPETTAPAEQTIDVVAATAVEQEMNGTAPKVEGLRSLPSAGKIVTTGISTAGHGIVNLFKTAKKAFCEHPGQFLATMAVSNLAKTAAKIGALAVFSAFLPGVVIAVGAGFAAGAAFSVARAWVTMPKEEKARQAAQAQQRDIVFFDWGWFGGKGQVKGTYGWMGYAALSSVNASFIPSVLGAVLPDMLPVSHTDTVSTASGQSVVSMPAANMSEINTSTINTDLFHNATALNGTDIHNGTVINGTDIHSGSGLASSGSSGGNIGGTDPTGTTLTHAATTTAYTGPTPPTADYTGTSDGHIWVGGNYKGDVDGWNVDAQNGSVLNGASGDDLMLHGSVEGQRFDMYPDGTITAHGEDVSGIVSTTAYHSTSIDANGVGIVDTSSPMTSPDFVDVSNTAATGQMIPADLSSFANVTHVSELRTTLTCVEANTVDIGKDGWSGNMIQNSLHYTNDTAANYVPELSGDLAGKMFFGGQLANIMNKIPGVDNWNPNWISCTLQNIKDYSGNIAGELIFHGGKDAAGNVVDPVRTTLDTYAARDVTFTACTPS